MVQGHPTPTQLAELERIACTPVEPVSDWFNRASTLPYGLTPAHVGKAMSEFVQFLGFINNQLNSRGIVRLETMLMPANFSSVVGEFMSTNIPSQCPSLVKNTYHNGHPDLLPAGSHPGNAAQHAKDGIEIKASRYLRGWQGHNPEDVWLMVFAYESGRPTDEAKSVLPMPFRFLQVLCARLTKADWAYAGRSDKSRRTITASVTQSGYAKMAANWVYRVQD